MIALVLSCAPARAAAPFEATDLNPVTLHPAPANDPIPLVTASKPRATLCLMGGASAHRDAIDELQRCIKLTTGVELPIVENEIHEPAIIIGECDASAHEGLRGADLPIEGLAIKTAPGRVYLIGNGAGLSWSIYEFAERFIGARWYFPGDLGRSVIKAADLAVPATWLTDAPAFRKRDIWPSSARKRDGTTIDLRPLHTALRAGNSWPINIAVHQPDWSKIAAYVQNRPEVFQLTRSGHRDNAMLCYSNPKTLESYLDQIARRIAGDLSAEIGMIGDTITVSPNDQEVACYCDDCRKLWDEKGGATGSASRIVGSFTARLARQVQKRWPDKTVLLLAYLNYQDAPDGVEFPSNVRVQICGMPGLANYKEPSVFAREQANLDKWFALTHHKVQDWHYSCWPEKFTKALYLFPHTIQKFYQVNRDKTEGSFVNGLGDHWPRQGVSMYTWLKILWNPDFNVDAAIDSYCNRMYGKGAGTLRQLIQLQIDGWENSRWPGGTFSADNVYTRSYPPATIARMKDLIATLRAQTQDDPIVAQRVAYYTAPFDAFFTEAADTTAGPRTPLIAQHISAVPSIDGKLDDPAWQRAQPVSLINGLDRAHRQAKYPTTVRAVWTADGVTIAFHMSEPAPSHLRTRRTNQDSTMLWYDDCAELLLDVTGKDIGHFYRFIITPAGSIADAHGKSFAWDARGVRAAAAVDADSWSVECYLPFSAVPEALRPGAGADISWQGNFTRHRFGDCSEPGKTSGSVEEVQRLNTNYDGRSDNGSAFAPIVFRN
jgi:hypothetical protein